MNWYDAVRVENDLVLVRTVGPVRYSFHLDEKHPTYNQIAPLGCTNARHLLSQSETGTQTHKY
jgi:hypothetical protein